MSFSRIALIGFGEVGQGLAADLAKAGVSDIAVFDIAFDRADSIPSRALGDFAVRAAKSAPEAVANAELIISAVTAAQDLAAAQSVAPGIAQDAFFLDVNSVSPSQKTASSEVIGKAGGRYVEAAVMAPFAPKRIGSPMLLGGAYGQEFLTNAKPLGFSGAEVFSEVIGQASAAKLCRSVMIKGVEALLTESMLSARAYGVEEAVLASLSDLIPVPDWPALARYMISRSLEHGKRRAEEMREAAETVAEAGVEPTMSRAIAERQDWAADRRAAYVETDLAKMLDAIRGLG